MKNKINIAKLLKDCPKGMELDCLMYEDVHFDYIDEFNIIHCYIQHKTHKASLTFNRYGTHHSDIKAKCVIFPKGKTTWEGFNPPCKFKVGDIISNGKTTIKIDYIDDEYYYEIGGNIANRLYIKNQDEWELVKDNIKPKFKVGDRIVKKNGICIPILITRVGAEYYYSNAKNSTGVLPIAEQDDWELVSNKFDINTLVPLESKVLIRDHVSLNWAPAIWGYYDSNSKGYKYKLIGGSAHCCIPYEGNEHLLGTTNDCDDFYKTWEY